jgi:hypothetical protein
MSRPALAWIIVLIGYLAVVVGVLLGFQSARDWAHTALSNPQATEEWQDWTSDEATRAASPDQPVRRRTPKSAEPPALVLLRDYFVAVVGASLVIATFAYALMAWMIWGVATHSSSAGYTLTDDLPPTRTTHGP